MKNALDLIVEDIEACLRNLPAESREAFLEDVDDAVNMVIERHQ